MSDDTQEGPEDAARRFAGMCLKLEADVANKDTEIARLRRALEQVNNLLLGLDSFKPVRAIQAAFAIIRDALTAKEGA